MIKKDKDYQIIEEVFCSKLLEIPEYKITLKEAQDVFSNYYKYTSQDKAIFSLPGIKKDIAQALNHYKENIENEDKDLQYLDTILKPYLK